MTFSSIFRYRLIWNFKDKDIFIYNEYYWLIVLLSRLLITVTFEGYHYSLIKQFK
jgi:hypothetical protein